VIVGVTIATIAEARMWRLRHSFPAARLHCGTMESLTGRATPIHVRKYDGSYHRRWPARYVLQKGPLYLLQFGAGEPVSKTPDPVDDPEPFMTRYGGDVWLWNDRWYNVARAKRDRRTWYYVNIATPVEFDGAQFHYVDLDLDVSWYEGEEPRVLDEDEFLDHSGAMGYPAAVIEQARAAVDEVLGMIQARAFPFDRG
jgi:protein associated with RNAse G/E